MRAAQSSASSKDAQSRMKKPPSASFTSAYGPSVTTRCSSRTRTVVALAVDASSSPPTRTPAPRAASANSPYCSYAASRSTSVIVSQTLWSAWISARYSMRYLRFVDGARLGWKTIGSDRNRHAFVAGSAREHPSSRIAHPLEQDQRRRFVEELVEVAALRALHAGRAARPARTAREQTRGVGHPLAEAVEAALCDADPSRMPFVDEHRRQARLLVDVRREAADVPAVAHREQRQQRDERVLGGVERRDEGRHRVDVREQRRRRREPDALGLVRRCGQVERRRVDHAAVGDRLPLVRNDLLVDVDPSMVELDAADAPVSERLDDRGLGLLPRLR